LPFAAGRPAALMAGATASQSAIVTTIDVI
jgi:hypothetical protein